MSGFADVMVRATAIPEPPDDLSPDERVDWVIWWVVQNSKTRPVFPSQPSQNDSQSAPPSLP